jgi:DNA-binding NtrC family response regulator
MKTSLSKKLFVVDDDPLWSALFVKTLNSLGRYNIFVISNAQDCLKSLDPDPKIIFLDYEMGDLNGLPVLKKINEKHPQMNVLLCTSSDDTDLAVTAVRMGSYDFMHKQRATKTNVTYLIAAMHENRQSIIKTDT